MKKFIFLTFFTFSTFFVGEMYAQNPTECSVIDNSNYDLCCTTAATNAIERACIQYRTSQQYCIDFPDDAACIPIRGGTQDSDSGDTWEEKQPWGTFGTPEPGDGTTPQAGSIEITSCSNIKLKSLFDILVWLKCIIAVAVIPLLFSLAFVVFLWGVFRFITASDVKSKQEGQKVIWWGIVGLFVMVSIWGIVQILGTILGTGTTVPTLQTEYLKKP